MKTSTHSPKLSSFILDEKTIQAILIYTNPSKKMGQYHSVASRGPACNSPMGRRHVDWYIRTSISEKRSGFIQRIPESGDDTQHGRNSGKMSACDGKM